MKGAHLHISNFLNESRIIKETTSLIESGVFDSIVIICLWGEGLLEEQYIHPKIKVVRLRTKFSGKQVSSIKKAPAFFKRFIQVLKEFNPDVLNVHQVKILPVIPLLPIFGIHAKYIYDAHELETETISLKGSKLKRVFKYVEKTLIRKFSLTIVVSDSINNWYQTKYGINNIVTVRNCPIAPDHSLNNDLFRENLGIPKNTMIFLYQGGISTGRGVELILECFSKNAFEDKCVVFLGYGALENMVKEFSIDHKNIYFHPAASPDVLLNYTSSADIGLSLIENTCLNEDYCLPNKLFEYLMAQIPIVVSDLKDQRSFIGKYDIGLVLEDFSAEALSAIIASMTWDKLKGFKAPLESAINDNHWGIEEKRMIEAYKAYVTLDK